MGVWEVRGVLDVAVARRWAVDSVAALAHDRWAIDRINVFPVADGDTGTNLLSTMRAAADAVETASPDTLGEATTAMAKGALSGARGNSGMLLSQVLRGFAEEFEGLAAADAACLRRALTRATTLARQAVTEPREGTLLSVLHEAVVAAEGGDLDHGGESAEVSEGAAGGGLETVGRRAASAHPDAVRTGGSGDTGVAVRCGFADGDDASASAGAARDDELVRVARAAVTGAVRALERTTRQLPELAEAGVVDAGGRGVVILLDVLHAALGGSRLAEEFSAAGAAAISGEAERHDSRYAYEVMYSLSEVDESSIATLRDGLSQLGDCVSVVGDGAGAWAVHVHCDDIGPAIELGIEAGRVRGIEVTRFADQQPVEQAVLACVRSDALAELFRAEGAEVLRGGGRPWSAVDLGAALDAVRARHIVVLPNDPAAMETAEEAARQAVRDGRDVVVVPTASPVQGLAALAVHDPRRRPSEDAVAMAEAAAATRRGELVRADQEALTWAGRCQPGDVLGLVDGEVVVLEGDVAAAARALLDRMLTAGGELVTALLATRAPSGLAEELADHLRRTHPEVELTCYDGGDLPSPLLLGIE